MEKSLKFFSGKPTKTILHTKLSNIYFGFHYYAMIAVQTVLKKTKKRVKKNPVKKIL